MAASVNEAFSKFMATIVNLDPELNKKARGSRKWLVEQIDSFPDKDNQFPRIYNDKNIFFGSFSRRTKKSPLDDIDIMICMSAAGCTYTEHADKIEITVPESSTYFKNYINDGTSILNSRKVINAFIAKLVDIPQYNKAEIKRNLEAATLNLESYEWTFDIVPCFFTTEDILKRTFYIIPDGLGNWKKTDPRIDDELVTKENTAKNGRLLQLIRILKYWNKRNSTHTIGSYIFELLVINYSKSKLELNQFIDYDIRDFFNYLSNSIYQTIIDPKGIQGNLNHFSLAEKNAIAEKAKWAYNKSKEAIYSEVNEKDTKKSINNWREIFGNDFLL
jgi:hypothetical protein